VERSDQSARESHGAARIIVFNEKKEREREKRERFIAIYVCTHTTIQVMNKLRDASFRSLSSFFFTQTHTRLSVYVDTKNFPNATLFIPRKDERHRNDDGQRDGIVVVHLPRWRRRSIERREEKKNNNDDATSPRFFEKVG